MKVTLKQIYNAVPALNSLAGQNMPVLLAYKLHKLIAELNEHLEAIEAARVSLVKSMIEEGEDNVPDDKMDEFDDQISTLFDEEVTIKWNKIPLASLGEVELSPAQVESILFLLREQD